jgi:quercetin dioxygenase-like cupin family protein
MKIENVPFMTTDWNKVTATTHAGETGTALWRTVEVGNLRVRIVEYSSGYLADHWCSRGHVVYVLEGEFVSELKDGRSFILSAGMSYQVATDAEPHRSSSKSGVKLLIVD